MKLFNTELHNIALREGWSSTLSAKKYWIKDPKRSSKNITLDDIIIALSNQCRFGGQVIEFFSVAQHSINVARLAKTAGESRQVQLACLMHDSHEAYILDIPTPMKLVFPQYDELEEQWILTIRELFNIEEHSAEVRKYDRISLFQEANEYQPNNTWASKDVSELLNIKNMTPKQARTEFKNYYNKLKGFK